MEGLTNRMLTAGNSQIKCSKRKSFERAVKLMFLFGVNFLTSSCVDMPGRIEIPYGKHFASGGVVGVNMNLSDISGRTSPPFFPTGYGEVQYKMSSHIEIGVHGIGIGEIVPYLILDFDNIANTGIGLHPSLSIPIGYWFFRPGVTHTWAGITIGIVSDYDFDERQKMFFGVSYDVCKSGSIVSPYGGDKQLLLESLGYELHDKEFAAFTDVTSLGFFDREVLEVGGYHFW